MKVCVVGAGIAGLTAAYYLARDGHSVTILERERHAGMVTSYANGAQISVSNSEVWTTWSNIGKAARWMFKEDAPLLLRPSLHPDKVLWMLRFLYHTVRNDYERNTIETIKLGLEARELYKQIYKEEQIQHDRSECGILHIYKSSQYFNAAIDAGLLYRHAGCDYDIVHPDQILNIEPALREATLIVGGAWTPNDSVGDIHKFCKQLAYLLQIKYGVRTQYSYSVEGIHDIDAIDAFDAIVLANGVGATKLSAALGERLPVYPVKGYSITVDLNSTTAQYAPHVSILDDEAKIVCSRLGNRLRVAGTAELDGENYDIRHDRIAPLLRWVHKTFPQIDTDNYSSWACLRPMTPNMLPIVRRSTVNRRVYYHAGHGHLGWTLAPATAQHLASIIRSDYGKTIV